MTGAFLVRLLMRRLVRLLFRRKRSDLRDLAMIAAFCVVTSAYAIVLGYFGGPLAVRIGLAVPFVFVIAMLALMVRIQFRRIERAKRNQAAGRPASRASASQEPPGPLRTDRT